MLGVLGLFSQWFWNLFLREEPADGGRTVCFSSGSQQELKLRSFASLRMTKYARRLDLDCIGVGGRPRKAVLTSHGGLPGLSAW